MNTNIEHPKVSVVMCCYNAERYIKQTIDSVLNQTYKDFEFIIWNDGSTDNTKEIIESYSDDRIRLFNDINRGEGKAGQLGCNEALGEYIARVDSDDIWLPSKLEEQLNFMETNPEVVLVSCPMIFIDQNNKELGLTFPITKSSYLTKTIKYRNRFPHSGAMYRTSIYKETGGYKDLRFFQDWLLFNEMSDYGKLALMPRPLIKYRLLPNSVMHRIVKSPYLSIVREFQRKIICDKGKNSKDIIVFNSLYSLIGKTEDNNDSVFNMDIPNRIYKVLSVILGRKIAYNLIIFMRNSLAINSLASIIK